MINGELLVEKTSDYAVVINLDLLSLTVIHGIPRFIDAESKNSRGPKLKVAAKRHVVPSKRLIALSWCQKK